VCGVTQRALPAEFRTAAGAASDAWQLKWLTVPKNSALRPLSAGVVMSLPQEPDFCQVGRRSELLLSASELLASPSERLASPRKLSFAPYSPQASQPYPSLN
jgi:hypothetical protein